MVTGLLENDVMKIYVDGAFVNSAPKTFTGIPATAAQLIGALTAGNYFLGSIDQVKIWNYALSDDQILEEYQGTLLQGNNRFDRTNIGAYQLFFSSATANGSYWIDRIELIKNAPFLEVTPSSVDFGGTVTGSPADHRFQNDPSSTIRIRYGGLGTPWTVRMWTDNSPGGGAEPEKAGLGGADGTTYIPLKVWCENFGPSAFTPPQGPDEENDYFWRGYDFNGNTVIGDSITSGSYSEATLGFDINGDGDTLDIITPGPATPLSEEPVWLRVPEKDEMEPGNIYTWRRLTWNDGAGNDAGLGGDFNIYLGVDSEGVKPQAYSTTTLTVEYINQ
jgi:hypothetical protein